MLKFKFLLWMMPKLLQRAINTKPACARYVEGKTLEFQIQTLDKVGRHFRIQDGKVKSFAGLTTKPKFALTFRNADMGFEILSAKDGKEAVPGGSARRGPGDQRRLGRSAVVSGVHGVFAARQVSCVDDASDP